MYYFRYLNENYQYIDISGKTFDKAIDNKLRVQFTEKNILSVFNIDENGELYPLKKSSLIYKEIFSQLEKSNWGLFCLDSIPISGLANEDGEIILPEIVLYPHISPKKPKNSFEYLTVLLNKENIPLFNDEDILKKHKSYEYLHVYFRKNDAIYHICVDNLSETLIMKEVFCLNNNLL